MNISVQYVRKVKPETKIAAACAARATRIDPVEIFSPMRGRRAVSLARVIAIHLVYTNGNSLAETGAQFGRSPQGVRSANEGTIRRCSVPDFEMAIDMIQGVYRELLRRHRSGQHVVCASLPSLGKRS